MHIHGHRNRMIVNEITIMWSTQAIFHSPNLAYLILGVGSYDYQIIFLTYVSFPCGLQCIRILSSSMFEISDQTGHRMLSCGDSFGKVWSFRRHSSGQGPSSSLWDGRVPQHGLWRSAETVTYKYPVAERRFRKVFVSLSSLAPTSNWVRMKYMMQPY